MTIPILGWHGLNADFTDLDRYREMAAAGFTHNLSALPSIESAVHALDVAREAGIKQYINVGQLMTQPRDVASQLRNHPALAGYYIVDEPAAGQFEQLGQIVRTIRSRDRKHPSYINLFPTYAAPGSQLGTASYQEYLDRFLQQVNVDFVSFDNYPITDKGLRADFYLNLELVSATCRREGKPFWAFALCTAHKPYPVPTLGHLRLQQYSNLAYGAQGLQYFTYLTPPSGTWDFHDGPIETDGRQTKVYDLVRRMNTELRAVCWVFEGATIRSIGHVGATLPQGTQPYQPSGPIQQVEVTGEGAVVSHLQNQGRQFLVIVNRDHRKSAELAVRWDSAATMSSVDKGGHIGRLGGAVLERSMEAGDACILLWE